MAARRRFSAPAWLLVAGLLAACPAPPVGPSADPGPGARPSRKPTASPSASAKPPAPTDGPSATAIAPVASGTPSAVPTAAVATPTAAPPTSLLARPAGAAPRVLAGVVRIDAGYAISAGSAQLVSNNGSTALGAPGAGVLPAAGNLIANNGGGLVGNNGSALISDKGGLLLSDNGALLVSRFAASGPVRPVAGGGTPAFRPPAEFRVLQAPTAAPGAVLPAGGLVVAVMALRTGLFVPLGQDPAGKPVYAVLTNAQGGFEVYTPADAGPLLVVTRFPEAAGAAAQADPRLSYDLLQDEAEAGAAPAEIVVDEDTAQVTRYVRVACAGTLQKFVLTDDVEATVTNISKDASPAIKEPLVALVREFRQASGEVGLDKEPPEVTAAVSVRMTDVLLSYLDIDGVALTKLYWPDWEGPEELAIPALADINRRLREGTTPKLAADPGFFDALPEVVEANALLPAGAPRYQVRKAADLGEFVMRAIVIPDRGGQRTDKVFAAVGVEEYQSDRLYAAVNNYVAAMAATALAQPEAKAAVLAEIRKPR